MTPDFSEFKKFPPDNFIIIEASSILKLRDKRNHRNYMIDKFGSDWVLSETHIAMKSNIISSGYTPFYRSPDLHRVLRLVGYDPKYDYHAWKRGDFDALVKRIQNS